MELRHVPIPAFYCCYFLRSTVSKTSQYVGSTPNPKRRLRQHNGLSKGGASRTSRGFAKGTLRPWEIACLVTGFQSRLAALQFEWAWQHAWKSKHLSASARKALTKEVKKTTKSGEEILKDVPRPQTLIERIKYLHAILQSPSFSRWPLTLHFLVEDVYLKWRSWDERSSSHISDNVRVSLDFEDIEEFSNVDDLPPSGQPTLSLNARLIDRLEITHKPLKAHLVKSEKVLTNEKTANCSVCSTSLQRTGQPILTCPKSSCAAASHMACLAQSFLAQEGPTETLIPTKGHCPLCKYESAWIDLVKEMSLRLRGQKEREALFKKPRKRKVLEDVASDLEEESEPDDEPLDDGWQPLDFDNQEDAKSVSSAASDLSDDDGAGVERRPPPKPRVEVVIEDSDDDALLL